MEQFRNPPIQEALIDIQVALPADVNLETLGRFHDGLEARFPERQERISWRQGFHIAKGEAQTLPSSRSVDGYLFVSKAEGKIVQVRCDGFTFNKLRPYVSWEAFNTEAKELWTRYIHVARPATISRVSLRYLNRILIPLPMRDLREYCVLFTDIPSSLPQGMSNFFLRFTMPIADTASAAIVTLTFEPPAPDTNALAVILDIDAGHVFGNLGVDTEAIWSKLSGLRDLKNSIFDASLTETAKALFR